MHKRDFGTEIPFVNHTTFRGEETIAVCDVFFPSECYVYAPSRNTGPYFAVTARREKQKSRQLVSTRSGLFLFSHTSLPRTPIVFRHG